MPTYDPELSEFLPGLAPEATRTPVFPSYERAIVRLRADGAIGEEHAGICASILALASVADNPMSKAYAVNDALKEAHEQMRTLLDVAAVQVDDEYAEFLEQQQS